MPEDWPADSTFDESSWSNLREDNPNMSTYNRSKTMAEKAAWDFQTALPEAERFEIVTINPALIMGPSYLTGDFASGQVMRGIMTSGEKCSRTRMGMVDVRDTAMAHLLAVTKEDARNRRFLLVSKCAWRKDMAACLAAEFNSKGFSINAEEATDGSVLDY